MKVLLIYFNTASRASIPLGLASLSNYIEKRGHIVEIFDTTFYEEFLKLKKENLREKIGHYKRVRNPVDTDYLDSPMTDDLKRKILEFQPDIIGLSILSAHFHFSCTISQFIKRYFPSIPIIVGGLHPTLKPEETICEPSVDMICIGEGEYAFTQLLERMESGENITDIKGTWVKQGDKIYRNELGRMTDMDDLPKMDWELFSPQHLYAPLDGRMYRVGPVEFSRGCPYSCAYCSINFLRDMYRPQKYLRRKSVDMAIEELIYLKDKYKIKMFYFLDETFLSSDIKYLEVFAEEYKRQVDVPFYGMTHPLSVSEKKVSLLEKMGCYLMTIGIECGNEKFRKNILNRKVSNQKIIDAFQFFKDRGIYASAFGMLGLPYETRELVFETIELFRKCQPRTYAVGIYKPFLGSYLRDVCVKEGFFDPSDDKYIYPDNTTVLNMPQFPREDIEGLFRTFYLYTKVSHEKFPLVEKSEKDDKILEELVNEYSDNN